jgi:sulfate adenylyltransferase large subunit
MATGASTADLAILLVDARHGVREQTRRHGRIAQLLGITNLVLAVNKMDLVGYDRRIFDEIRSAFAEIQGDALVHAIPISALNGDNVITTSDRTPWFEGPSLLEHLETVEIDRTATRRPLRFPVQLVVRPSDDFRGYAGQICSGVVSVGDSITVWPANRSTRVQRIVTWDGDLEQAFAPMSVTLTLEDELDISRGDVLASGATEVGNRFEADIVWMDERPLDSGRVYLLKHGATTVSAEVDRPFTLNEIGTATVVTSRAIPFDSYHADRSTGSFILIDPATNFTAGAGMIIRKVTELRGVGHQVGAAGRLAQAARMAASESEAVDAVRRVLEEILT